MSKAPPENPTPPSYLLEGRYLAEKLVARGDNTDVYSGTDTWSGELVAIRMLRPDRLAHANAFLRMSERLFGTASPRLVRALHIGEDRDGSAFLVTEMLLGRTVESLGRVRWEVAVEITRQAAAAIAEMHLNGLHHGALEPSTFFVAAQNAGGSRVKLLDLGTGERTATAESDVRGLVSILHRLLLGRAPVPGQPLGTTLRNHVAGVPPALETALSAWLGADGEGVTAAGVVAELKAITDAATGQFWSGQTAPGGSTSGALPRPSMIMVEAPESGEDDDDVQVEVGAEVEIDVDENE